MNKPTKTTVLTHQKAQPHDILARGSNTMSQRDAMSKAMSSAYQATYGKVPVTPQVAKK